jgi:hypothetical protein
VGQLARLSQQCFVAFVRFCSKFLEQKERTETKETNPSIRRWQPQSEIILSGNPGVLIRSGSTARILKTAGLDRLATEALGAKAFPINATYFDKTAEANWAVPGHQDLMMPVECEIPESGFSGWRTKLGVTYVEPPTEVLEKLVALRVHIDDCPASNGALAVVPGSHLRRKLRSPEISKIAVDQYTICAAEAGDVLLMKPLVVHRSSPAAHPGHRRVLHIVYAASQPGVEVRWKRAP